MITVEPSAAMPGGYLIYKDNQYIGVAFMNGLLWDIEYSYDGGINRHEKRGFSEKDEAIKWAQENL